MKKILVLFLISIMFLSSCTTKTDDSINNDNEIGDNMEELNMYVRINSNSSIKVSLVDNSSTRALLEILNEKDITYKANDYGDFEKVGNIGYTLPSNNESITTVPGDIILYQGVSICLYYGVNTWNFTRIGRVTGYSSSEIRELFSAGSGEITVTLSLNM